MKLILIKKLGTRKGITGRKESWGEFQCGFCINIVEKRLNTPAKSCGCSTERLISEFHKGKNKSEGHRKKISESNKGKKKSEEHKLKMSISKQGKKLSNQHKIKLSLVAKGKKLTEEHKLRISIGNKGKKRTEEQNRRNSESHKGKYSGKNSPSWQGGKSFEPYSPEFNKELKQQIHVRDNYTCQDPNCLKKTHILHIHHIDYNKKNNNPKNLIILCAKCHAKTNGKNKRKNFTEFYSEIVSGYL